MLLRGDESAGGRIPAVTDRPRHRELRALMWRAVSPKAALDHYQVRHHPAWYRHITLAMAAAHLAAGC
ncbi:hypothetical protein [Streptomyces olivochromogenes]|uniref:hypothetical protein n=1 Tax=Streptomyces olivochromogenes TaxID=1963 RepID=UPI00369ABE18